MKKTCPLNHRYIEGRSVCLECPIPDGCILDKPGQISERESYLLNNYIEYLGKNGGIPAITFRMFSAKTPER